MNTCLDLLSRNEYWVGSCSIDYHDVVLKVWYVHIVGLVDSSCPTVVWAVCKIYSKMPKVCINGITM